MSNTTQPPENVGEVVQVWHGDPFIRAVLVAVLFLIGLVMLMSVSIMRWAPYRSGQIQIRPDLWEWLAERSDDSEEPVAATESDDVQPIDPDRERRHEVDRSVLDDLVDESDTDGETTRDESAGG